MLNYYGLDVDDSYDGANDLEMFKTVGHPIAMKNAIPMIYHHASIICEDVLHDGVAKELKEIFNLCKKQKFFLYRYLVYK